MKQNSEYYLEGCKCYPGGFCESSYIVIMLRLNLLNSFSHHFVTLALLIVGILGLYKGIVDDSSNANEIIVLSSLCTLWGISSLYRDIRLLRFRKVIHNGLDKNHVITITLEILEAYGWNVSLQYEDKIVARGYGISRDRWRFFRSSKLITILLREDHILINCIVEPPDSTRYSFGHNKRIMQDFEDEFHKRSSLVASI